MKKDEKNKTSAEKNNNKEKNVEKNAREELNQNSASDRQEKSGDAGDARKTALLSLREHVRRVLEKSKVEPILDDILRGKEFEGSSRTLRERALSLVEAMREQITEEHLEKIINACYSSEAGESFEKAVEKVKEDYSPFGVRDMLTKLLRKMKELDQEAIGEILGKGTDELEADLIKQTSRAEEYLCALKVVKADFDNYRKRMERDRAEFKKTVLADFMLTLLPTLDALDAALEDCKCIGPKEGEGLEKVRRLLTDALVKAGLEKINALGEKFDHNFHEAVSHEYVEGKEPDTVIDVLRSGWIFGGRVLRPALVRVAAAETRKEETAEKTGEGQEK